MSHIKGKQIKDQSLDLEKLRSGSKLLPDTAVLGSQKTVEDFTNDNEFVSKQYVDTKIEDATGSLVGTNGIAVNGSDGISFTGGSVQIEELQLLADGSNGLSMSATEGLLSLTGNSVDLISENSVEITASNVTAYVDTDGVEIHLELDNKTAELSSTNATDTLNGFVAVSYDKVEIFQQGSAGFGQIVLNGDVNGVELISDKDILLTSAKYASDYGTNFTDRSLVDKAYVDTQIGTATESLFGTNGIAVNGTDGISFIGGDVEVSDLKIESTSGTIEISAPSVIVSGSDIKYSGDYSLNFTDRSLVDKAYVDMLASGLDPKESVKIASSKNLDGFTYNIVTNGSESNDELVYSGNVEREVVGENETTVFSITNYTEPVEIETEVGSNYRFSATAIFSNGVKVTDIDTANNINGGYQFELFLGDNSSNPNSNGFYPLDTIVTLYKNSEVDSSDNLSIRNLQNTSSYTLSRNCEYEISFDYDVTNGAIGVLSWIMDDNFEEREFSGQGRFSETFYTPSSGQNYGFSFKIKSDSPNSELSISNILLDLTPDDYTASIRITKGSGDVIGTFNSTYPEFDFTADEKIVITFINKQPHELTDIRLNKISMVTITEIDSLLIEEWDVELNDGDRILVKNQYEYTENGIYVLDSVNNKLVRSKDSNTSTEVSGGNFTFVEQGMYANSGFVLQGNGNLTINTDSINWVQFSGAGQITAGNGLKKEGNTLELDLSYYNTEENVNIYSEGNLNFVANENGSINLQSYGGNINIQSSINDDQSGNITLQTYGEDININAYNGNDENGGVNVNANGGGVVINAYNSSENSRGVEISSYSGDFNANAYGNDINLNAYSGDVDINSYGGDLNISANQFIVTSNNGRGIQYQNDYSGGFEERSLVDKGYVDRAVTNSDAKNSVILATNQEIPNYDSVIGGFEFAPTQTINQIFIDAENSISGGYHWLSSENGSSSIESSVVISTDTDTVKILDGDDIPFEFSGGNDYFISFGIDVNGTGNGVNPILNLHITMGGNTFPMQPVIIGESNEFITYDSELGKYTMLMPTGGNIFSDLTFSIVFDQVGDEYEVVISDLFIGLYDEVSGVISTHIDNINIELSTGDRILVKDQADYTQNGIYIVDQENGRLIRETVELNSGIYTFVEQGTFRNQGFLLSVADILEDVDTLSWTAVTGSGGVQTAEIELTGYNSTSGTNGQYSFDFLNANNILIAKETGKEQIFVNGIRLHSNEAWLEFSQHETGYYYPTKLFFNSATLGYDIDENDHITVNYLSTGEIHASDL